MFRTRDQLDDIAGGVTAAAVLSHDLMLEDATPAKGWRERMDVRMRKLDVTHDLAEQIGSGRWYRGLVSMLGLGIAALAFWPDFSAVEAATAIPADAQTRDEFRSQMITPLALGADNGRRMGATAAVVPLAQAPERPTAQLVTTLGTGDSFGRMLQRAGVGATDAGQVSDMVAAVLPLGEVGAGTQVAIELGRRAAPGEPRPLEKLSFRARFDLDLAVERRGGALTLSKHALAVDTTPLRIRGSVGPSLFLSARGAGAPMKAIEQYLQTIAEHMNLDGDMAPTDQFDMIVAYKRSASGEREVGDLLYAGLERDGKARAQLVRWKDGRFVDGAEQAQPQVAAAGMVAPVNGRMTSPYGARRHPILGYVRMHAGIDFGAPWGSPIFAVSDGIVSFAGRHGGHGNYVRLEHGGGIGTGYGHMSRIAVSPGTRVHTGQVIGYVGSTGLSTGPHLHYELYQNGRTVNPASVRFTFKTVQVDQGEIQAIKARIAQLKGSVSKAAALKFVPIAAKAAAATK